jgi:hypothetical protein
MLTSDDIDMNADLFDLLASTLKERGSRAAIEQLCLQLRERREYSALFYALLVQKRQELGVNPIPTGSAEELPVSVHEAYEEAIRSAARQVGQLFLEDRNIPQAWFYFRMIGEPEPVRAALEAYQPGEDEDIQPLVHISFYEGVHPTRGFDWILSRYGICSAITTASGGELPHTEEVRQHCIRALIRALYGELRDRLTADIEARFSIPPAEKDTPPSTPGVIRKLLEGRDWLFDEDAYHIDTSHLSSVVQMAMLLRPCQELGMARELCTYGSKLTGRFMGRPDDPPFEQGYRDYEVYLRILSGEEVDRGIAHFRDKVEQCDPEEVGTYPAEVLVNLLLRLDRGTEALELSRKYLARAEQMGRQLTCPNLNELCQRFKAYDLLADVARELNDPVFFLAGRIAAQQMPTEPRTK